MIFITSSGEIFLLLFHCQFFLVHFTIKKKKKKRDNAAGLLLVLILSCCRSSCSSGIEFSIKVEFEPNGTRTVWSACGRG